MDSQCYNNKTCIKLKIAGHTTNNFVAKSFLHKKLLWNYTILK